MAEHRSQQGYAKAARDDSQHQDVDVGPAGLPLDTVQRQAFVPGQMQHAHDEGRDHRLFELHRLEEALQTAVRRGVPSRPGSVAGDMAEVDRPVV